MASGELLKQIQAGKKLKKAETNDRSGPSLDPPRRGSTGRSGGGAVGAPSASSISLPSSGGPPQLGSLFAAGMPKLKPTSSTPAKPSNLGRPPAVPKERPPPTSAPSLPARVVPPKPAVVRPPKSNAAPKPALDDYTAEDSTPPPPPPRRFPPPIRSGSPPAPPSRPSPPIPPRTSSPVKPSTLSRPVPAIPARTDSPTGGSPLKSSLGKPPPPPRRPPTLPSPGRTAPPPPPRRPPQSTSPAPPPRTNTVAESLGGRDSPSRPLPQRLNPPPVRRDVNAQITSGIRPPPPRRKIPSPPPNAGSHTFPVKDFPPPHDFLDTPKVYGSGSRQGSDFDLDNLG